MSVYVDDAFVGDDVVVEGGCQVDGCDCFYYEPDEEEAGNG